MSSRWANGHRGVRDEPGALERCYRFARIVETLGVSKLSCPTFSEILHSLVRQ